MSQYYVLYGYFQDVDDYYKQLPETFIANWSHIAQTLYLVNRDAFSYKATEKGASFPCYVETPFKRPPHLITDPNLFPFHLFVDLGAS